VVWWLAPNFWNRGGMGSSAHSALFFAGAGRGEGKAVVAPGIHIRFLIEY
jgi:RimJ/RimL family protein N-acetyltransferase